MHFLDGQSLLQIINHGEGHHVELVHNFYQFLFPKILSILLKLKVGLCEK
jgi:hypothetical protein